MELLGPITYDNCFFFLLENPPIANLNLYVQHCLLGAVLFSIHEQIVLELLYIEPGLSGSSKMCQDQLECSWCDLEYQSTGIKTVNMLRCRSNTVCGHVFPAPSTNIIH